MPAAKLEERGAAAMKLEAITHLGLSPSSTVEAVVAAILTTRGVDPMHEQVVAEQRVRESIAIPLEQRSTNFETNRARAAYEAFADNFDQTQIDAMKRIGISLAWEGLDPSVRRGWIKASAVAAAYR